MGRHSRAREREGRGWGWRSAGPPPPPPPPMTTTEGKEGGADSGPLPVVYDAMNKKQTPAGRDGVCCVRGRGEARRGGRARERAGWWGCRNHRKGKRGDRARETTAGGAPLLSLGSFPPPLVCSRSTDLIGIAQQSIRGGGAGGKESNEATKAQRKNSPCRGKTRQH